MKLRKQTYFISAIVVLALVLFFILAIRPLFLSIKNNSQELIAAKTKIIALDAEINNLGLAKKQYQDCQDDLAKIDNLFINAEVPINFINSLKKMAQDSNLLIEIPSVSGGTGQPWQFLNFQLSTTGTFLHQMRFLEKLENSPYLIEMVTLTINRAAQEKGSQIVGANLLIKVFAK
jgi:hypothetical protein